MQHKKIEGERTTRGFQANLLSLLTKICQKNQGICTLTTRELAQKVGTSRRVCMKGLRDLDERGLILRETPIAEDGRKLPRCLAIKKETTTG